MKIWIRETFLDADRHAEYGESAWYETRHTSLGELFRSLRSEYGAAKRMYIDVHGGGTRQIGWVFRGRTNYEGSQDTYTREVWVEVSVKAPQHVPAYWTGQQSPWKAGAR